MDWLVRCGVGGIYVFWRSEPQGKAIVVSVGCCFVSLDRVLISSDVCVGQDSMGLADGAAGESVSGCFCWN